RSSTKNRRFLRRRTATPSVPSTSLRARAKSVCVTESRGVLSLKPRVLITSVVTRSLQGGPLSMVLPRESKGAYRAPRGRWDRILVGRVGCPRSRSKGWISETGERFRKKRLDRGG
ncbi:unnamed protein product, partial [Ascophyllum nodosum]